MTSLTAFTMAKSLAFKLLGFIVTSVAVVLHPSARASTSFVSHRSEADTSCRCVMSAVHDQGAQRAKLRGGKSSSVVVVLHPAVASTLSALPAKAHTACKVVCLSSESRSQLWSLAQEVLGSVDLTSEAHRLRQSNMPRGQKRRCRRMIERRAFSQDRFSFFLS